MTDSPYPAPTQTTYPWKAALRTFVQAFISFAGIAAIAAPELQMFIDQFWPGSPVIAWIGVGAAFIGAIAALISRLMAIPGVNEFLTQIGLGATPK